MKVKFLYPILGITLLGLMTTCDDIPFDDDQYGDVCNVVKVEILNTETTTLEYDQYDMLTEISTFGSNIPTTRMVVVYNNNTAFADFYLNGQFYGSAEAPIDENGNLLSCIWTDSTGVDVAEETFFYDAEGHLIQVNGTNYFTGSSESLFIEWTNGNPTKFLRTMGPTIACEYFTGQFSSLRMGQENVVFLFQEVDANVAMMFSQDLLKVYDREGIIIGEPMYLEYEIDSDGKARILYWSTESNGNFGTTNIDYDCHGN